MLNVRFHVLYRALPTSDHELIELRPIVQADLKHWFEYLSMPVVYQHTSWNLSSVRDLANYVLAETSPTPESLLRLAIADRASGKLVGTVGFHSVSPQDRRAEIAYDLAPQMWGKGLATSLVTLLVAWAHEHVGITRVQATVLESNRRSSAVLERCGFAFEGVLRSYRQVRGAPGDFRMYSHVA
jgi:[ribosomal protein S5]-alanine N-acetyltransferase